MLLSVQKASEMNDAMIKRKDLHLELLFITSVETGRDKMYKTAKS